MNLQQQRFADAYLVHGNATRAYKEAGYKGSGNSAEVTASQLLRNPKVAAYIDAQRAVAAEKAGITVEWIAEQLKAIVEMGVCQRKTRVSTMVEGVATDVDLYKPDLSAANSALEKLGKWRKMFGDDASAPRENIHHHYFNRPRTKEEWLSSLSATGRA